MTESLAGRFETLHLSHWPFAEMREAFGWSLDQYLFHGGYPGAAPLIGEPARWSRYVADSLIETSIARDVLLLSRVDKPALLRRLFDLACHYSGQVLSYTKMLASCRMQATPPRWRTIWTSSAGAGMVRALPKYAGDVARRRGSSPKLQVLNTALMTATSGLSLAEARADREFWGRLVELAEGRASGQCRSGGGMRTVLLARTQPRSGFRREGGPATMAIEVKSGRVPLAHAGSAAFAQAFKVHRTLLVGGDGVSVEDFLLRPVAHWVGS